MNDRPIALVTGLDPRMAYAAKALCSFAEVYSCGLNGSPEGVTPLDSPEELHGSADLILLPMMNNCGNSVPTEFGKLPVKLVAQAAKNGAVAAGGLLTNALLEELDTLGLRAFDYFKNETLQIKNALLTAEGALSVAASQREEALFGMPVLITGWGRVAKACAKVFGSVGAEVSIAARSQTALAEAHCFGCKTLPLCELSEHAEKYSLLINTIPALVVTDEIIRRTQRNCLIVDLASKPGGVDSSACALCGRAFIHALALPGKYAPKTAGEIIAETVEGYFRSAD